MPLKDLTAEAINKAIREFDRVGRDEFLKTYGFGKSRGYFAKVGNKQYDSKAIAGAAHQFIGAGYSALAPSEFSGGEQTVATILRNLGFEVTTPAEHVEETIPFEIGKTYNRQQEIHEVFGGQERGGIATPSGVPFVFLFTGEAGGEFGYEDGWQGDGTFGYTGEGQKGDMSFVRGNRAIRDHLADGKDLLLFEALPKKGRYRFLGCFSCAGWEMRPAKDVEGNDRNAIIFQLVPNGEVPTEPSETLSASEPIQRTLEQLRSAAYKASKPAETTVRDAKRTYFQRSVTVKAYVLARANGVCESCLRPAPFTKRDGTPYLEPHHTQRLADGGPDEPRWVGAICPTCHREVHHGANGKQLNERLKDRLASIEEGLGKLTA